MKTVTAIFVAAALTAFSSIAGAEMPFSGFASSGSSLKFFDLQRQLTASDIAVPELQKEMLREVPAGSVPSIPSGLDKRPRSPKSGGWAPQTEIQRSLF